MYDIIPKTELDSYNNQVKSVEKYSVSLEVKNENDYQSALVEAKTVKEQLEIITTRKEAITKPLYVGYKSAMELFKPFETALKTNYDIIRAKMVAYTDEKEKKIEIANAKIDARLEKGTITESQANVKKFVNEMSVQKTVSTGSGSATTKKVAKYYVTDLSKVPLEFLEVDMVKVKASYKSGFPVPGTEVRMESELSIK